MAGVSRGYVSRLEAGDFARPSAALLLRIARVLDIDVGDLWDDLSGTSAPPSERPTLLDLSDQLLQVARALATVRGLPIRGVGSAGTGDGSDEGSLGVFKLEDDQVPPRRWAMLVEGDSLKDDGIYGGDYAIVDPDIEPREGQLVVARVGEDILIKHYVPEAGSIVLEPANPDYPAIDAPQAQILGAVYAVVRIVA
jgi:transcriptional regulator with XRE-family HTH domain